MIQATSETAPEPNIFQVEVRALLGELFKEAASSLLRKFAIGKTAGPLLLTIHGFAQCTPNLTKEQCIQCLENEIPRFLKFLSFNITFAIFYGVPCNFGYEVSQLSTMLM